MRPGQIPLTPEPADESIRPNVNCPNCGSSWHVDAAVCGNCGWRLPAKGGQASTPCPLGHQSKYVDSFTKRCTHCQPIQIEELQPELQAYARRARYHRYKALATGILMGPFITVVYASTGPSRYLFIPVLLGILFFGISLYAFMSKRNLLLRYYRLGSVMRYVKPIDAELKYSAHRTKAYFYLCQLGPDSLWRGVRKNKIRVDFPVKEDLQLVNNTYSITHLDFFVLTFKGGDPTEPDHFWAKVYFDPDQSGSAVIRIANSTFVSAKENYEIY